MNNKLAIAIATLMVVALAAPAVMAANTVNYTARVVTSDVSVEINNADFGDLLAGTSKSLSPSLTLTNSGGAAADVDAKFTTETGGVYGLVSETDNIPAASVKIDSVALNNDGTSVSLTQVLAHDGTNAGTVSYDATLDVPASQAVGSYSGTVQLTFTAV